MNPYFQLGEDVLFDCHVDVDPRWNNTLEVNWLKEEKIMNLTKLAYDQNVQDLETNQRFVFIFHFFGLNIHPCLDKAFGLTLDSRENIGLLIMFGIYGII